MRSKKLLEPARATDWSITHSPTPRYLLIHFDMSLFSPETSLVLRLFVGSQHPDLGYTVSCLVALVYTHVRPVDRFMPAKKAETTEYVSKRIYERKFEVPSAANLLKTASKA